MNTNSNTYTVIYSTVLVVVVAAVLAFAAMSLKPRQDENIKIETISKVLGAATQSSPSVNIAEDTDVMALYADKVTEAFYVDGYGNPAGEMNTGKSNIKDIAVASTGDLKKQNDIMKQIESGKTDLLSSLRLPVYIFNIDGKEITVMPCYGAGLWGPIWGYIAVAEDGKTITGAVFDHKSETPGLGAKIAEEPFYSQFAGKEFSDSDVKFSVVKGGAHGDINGVDAISGATITSQSLGKTINVWAKYYEPYFKSAAAAAASAEEECCCQCGEETEETANNEEE
ncbi:MAG: NADH:ubiquinone reductase (Na(+)-transporting) subunit C [Bacteroidales bacterium]|nr:NADH:ubiquinone reductase (Na(+)-transporting) subunit C [Bacteroides sp.]MCM1197677.1 NADH:ubiquinone reductase (Na(+)-transporting) subunit C [Clostridium sp.]MCM1501893.1 NADH:ubiquinone reductase (Na(+)-transporting) subunit C [Bacteroidales bacterium]